MIAKSKAGQGFGGLARYLLHDQDGNPSDRVAWTQLRNLPLATPEEAAVQMRATAHQNTWVQKPVYHISLNWSLTDQPTQHQMEWAVDRLLRDLGLQEHQALLVAHSDTEHRHVHIMVNRVHPETRVAWSHWHDWERIEESLRRLERDMGWRVVPGRLHNGTRPAQGAEIDRLRKLAWDPMHTSRNWAELENRLQHLGLALKARGRGLILTDGRVYIKASQIHRSLSRSGLEERYGKTFREWRHEVRQVQKLARHHQRIASKMRRAASPGNVVAARAVALQARARAHQARSLVEGSGDLQVLERKMAGFAVRYGLRTIQRVSPAAAAILQAVRMARSAMDRERSR